MQWKGFFLSLNYNKMNSQTDIATLVISTESPIIYVEP